MEYTVLPFDIVSSAGGLNATKLYELRIHTTTLPPRGTHAEIKLTGCGGA